MEPSPRHVGRQLGHYEVLALLGEGGIGAVYAARDTKLGRKVALKLLPRDFTDDPNRLRRFEQEARAASALNHTNILTIYEIGETDETQFIATESEEALKWLRVTVVEDFPCYPLFARDQFLDPIRKDPDVIRFMTEMKERWEGYQREFG